MFDLLKDGANKLKAKIGGDQLDEKLADAVSEENWQASTQLLHEIANAAYNYEKWQRINEFIWEKLKKSKSWKKILKTLNLIDFLLKNGPPSVISSFKYDIYQLRAFENYSQYSDGTDKGEPIRQRAKTVVALLGNEEQLEEERVKAKTIREKMSNVLGGGGNYGSQSSSNSGYGYGGSNGYSGYGYGGSNKNDNYQSKKKKDESKNAYNYGNEMSHFGDYNYNKSTLDKYKDASKNNNSKSNTTTSSYNNKEEQSKPQVVVETKKPFEKIASKLQKPGAKKEEVVQQAVKTSETTATTTNKQPTNNSIGDIFEFDVTTPPPQPVQTSVQPVQQPVQQPIQAQSSQNNQFFLESLNPTQQIPQQSIQPPIHLPNNMHPQFNQPQQPQQPQQNTFNNFMQPQMHQQGYPNQPVYQNPVQNYNNPQFSQYPPQYQQNAYNLQQFPHQQQIYNNQPQYNAYGGYQNNNTQPNNYGNQPAQRPVSLAPQNQNIGLSLNLTNNTSQNSQSVNSSSTGTANNVNWLSNTEKGLIDFSDFGSQIKKDNSKQTTKTELNNNIAIDTWNW